MSKLPLTADAVELADLIANGQVSATEALDDALERTALIDPKLNALCLLRSEQAREMAAQIDQSLVARAAPLPNLPHCAANVRFWESRRY
ncbi:MAG: hypothetical protein ACO3BH_08650 [Quisquiliibacterium sp.]